MSSDKNIKDLGKFLKVLQQPIRREILKKLSLNDVSFSFSALQKEVLGKNSNSVNFSFHLNSLKDLTLICSQDEGYFITNLGKKILKFIEDMEQVLKESKKPIMIRTSKYSKEQFDVKKIKEYLIQEGQLEINLANHIAEQVSKRLSATKINYLTAPLMREYINAILLENDLEEVRHRLTRLGTPPSEVSKYFENPKINPAVFMNVLGTDVSEQFFLLNLIPKNLADMYLSGEIHLLHLDYWALRPLSIYLHTDTILEEINRKYSNFTLNFTKLREAVLFILKFIDFLKIFRPFFSEDLLLNKFNSKFLTCFNNYNIEKEKFLFELLASQILEFSDFHGDHKSHVSLEFDYADNKYVNDEHFSLYQKDKIFLQKIQCKNILSNNCQTPLILFDYFNKFTSNNLTNSIGELIALSNIKNIVFYHQKSSNLLNSVNIKVKSPDIDENRIILDKILINLYKIAQTANRDDNMFFSLIQNKLKSVFELFQWKMKLISRKLQKSKEWNYIITSLLKKNMNEWKNEVLKSISFIGLNEAIVYHCGLELDRTPISENFALDILSLFRDLIREKNEEEDEYFVLTQPHNFNPNNETKNLRIPVNYKNQKLNSCEIIRNSSNLDLDKKILLFKKFEKIVDGGILFTYVSEAAKSSNSENLKKLLESNLHAFTIKY